MKLDELQFQVGARNGSEDRLVIAQFPAGEHRDTGDTNKSSFRKRFLGDVAEKTGLPLADVLQFNDHLVHLADDADTAAALQRDADAKESGGRAASQATTLVSLAEKAGVELWHTADGDTFATIPIDGHREHWGIRTKAFRRWLARQFYLHAQAAPGGQAQQDAIGVLEGKAQFDGAEYAVAVRVGGHDGAIYLDLCDSTWQVVQITAAGWTVITNPPVRFRRSKSMLPLPVPMDDGTLGDLRFLLNVTADEWPLIAAWQLSAMRNVGPYPVLNLSGEQGSGKTTAARATRSLTDPNTAPVRSQPREPRDLMIAANNGWVITLDNLSSIQDWLSDGLCRLSTGGGFSTRTLYENDEETIFNACRPIIVNGIEELAVRGDLLDRSLVINLPTIAEENRKPEAVYWRQYAELQPGILGALCSAVSKALGAVGSVKLPRLPRMADFALWSVAGESALGLQPGQFITAYAENRSAGNTLALEASQVAGAIIAMMEATSEWSNTASELLRALEKYVDEKVVKSNSWPHSPRSLAGAVKRLAPNLRAVGIEVDMGGHIGRGNAKRKAITLIRRSAESIAPTNPTSPNPGKQGSSGGDGVASGGDGVANED